MNTLVMQTGDWLGRFRIVSKIGEGGMGEVYLADDPKLDRQIALKVLTADFAANAERMARFVYEAKSASALNHPNIITIHEINDEHDTPFIAMEHVEGETLGRKMKNCPLENRESIDIAIQVAAALAAAHEAKIIHRDIKPDNVIVRPDGLVKVLDFGLAKQIETASAAVAGGKTVPEMLTHPGFVIGTIAYMSPEQARGQTVDARSDIFSFGSMLYQMVSGRLPFAGENNIDIIASILHKEPRSLSQSARLIPHDMDTMIRKALRKNRDERYQTMRELLADLRELRQQMDSGGLNVNGNGSGYDPLSLSDFDRGLPTEPMNLYGIGATNPISIAPSTFSGILLTEFREHPLKSFAFSALAAILIAGSAFGLYRLVDWSKKPETFQTMRFTKLTYSGTVAAEQAAVSPDGKYIAYVTQEPDKQGLWVKQTATESNVQIVPPSAQIFTGVTFAPDANFIYYSTIEKEGLSSLYQVPALGGPSRKLATDAKGAVAFSPDGKQMVFVRRERFLMLANPDGSDARILATGKDRAEWLRLGWSPDGNVIAASYYSPADNRDHLVGVSVSDGSEITISLDPWHRLRGIAWLKDGSGLLVSGRDLETLHSQIWLIDYPSGNQRRITNDLNNYQGLSLTADGLNIVSTQPNIVSDIWTTELDGAEKVDKVTSDPGKGNGISGVALASDGRIVYTTGVNEQQDVWIANHDGSGTRQLTFNSQSNFSPTVSPVGDSIVFVSTRLGNPDIWKMDNDGSAQVPLVSSSAREAEPSFSADGKWVIFQSTDAGNETTLWKVGIDGGEPIQITKTDTRKPIVSPDNKYIACTFGTASANSSMKLGIVSLENGEMIRVLNETSIAKSRVIRWSPDSKSVIYIDGKNQIDNLWSQPLDNSDAKQLTDFGSDRIFRFDISKADGKIVVARGSDTSDVVMISNFR